MTAREISRFGALFLFSFLAACQKRETIVEFSSDQPSLPPPVFHATCEYEPTGTEQQFYERLDNSSCVTIQTKPGEFTDEADTFILQGHQGQFVSWFGIVRDIQRDLNGNGGVLLIENKYSMGITDCDIQTVEINGAGDFKAQLAKIPDDLVPLVLVRVYGTITKEENNLPLIKADYVRVWHWGQFNFSSFGEDHGNPRWKGNVTGNPDDVYNMRKQHRSYYKECVGPTPEQWEILRTYYRRQTIIDVSRFAPIFPDTATTPTKIELDYFDHLKSKNMITVQSRPGEAPHSNFSLRGHIGEFVSWFGIVRGAKPAIFKPGGTLLIEHKYFDGASDERLQTVSIKGGGNFRAELTRFSKQITPLILVRVYGVVVREERRGPVVDVAYVRAWPWGRFNFKDYGQDRGDRFWKKNMKLKSGEGVYKTAVSPDYYAKLLGPSEEQKHLLEAEIQAEKEARFSSPPPTTEPGP